MVRFYVVWDRSMPMFWNWIEHRRIMIDVFEGQRILKDKNILETLLNNGIDILCDSGGYKFTDKRKITLDYKKVSEIQSHFGKGVSVDFPINPHLSIKENKKRWEWTINNSLKQLEYVEKRYGNYTLYLSVQGWDFDSLRKCIETYKQCGGKILRFRRIG